MITPEKRTWTFLFWISSQQCYVAKNIIDIYIIVLLTILLPTCWISNRPLGERGSPKLENHVHGCPEYLLPVTWILKATPSSVKVGQIYKVALNTLAIDDSHDFEGIIEDDSQTPEIRWDLIWFGQAGADRFWIARAWGFGDTPPNKLTPEDTAHILRRSAVQRETCDALNLQTKVLQYSAGIHIVLDKHTPDPDFLTWTFLFRIPQPSSWCCEQI